MPPLVPSYVWEQDEHQIVLTISFRGVKAEDIDIYVARTFLKVSFGKYLLALDLLHSIDDESVQASAKIGGKLILTMQKLKGLDNEGIWPSLTVPLKTLDKGSLAARRAHAIEERRGKEQSLHKATQEKKKDFEVQVLKSRMEMDEARRAQQERTLNEEKQLFFALDTGIDPQETLSTLSIPTSKSLSVPVAPAVRSESGRKVINVTFTPRMFPTPLRESKKPDEDLWIKKFKPAWNENVHQKLEARNHDEEPKYDDMRSVSERDPFWLKARGDNMCRAGDYESAINAYTTALCCDSRHRQHHLLLGNRALCFFRIRRYQECADDCTEALKLLQSSEHQDSDASVGILLQLYARRGASVCQMGNYAIALKDYRMALYYSPNDLSLKMDIEKLTREVNEEQLRGNKRVQSARHIVCDGTS